MKLSKKARARRRVQAEADAECRQAVFERDGFKCVFCGSAQNLQWMHILSRRDKTIRCDPNNSVVGCAGCHLKWHHEPAIYVPKFIQMYPDRYEYLLAKRRERY